MDSLEAAILRTVLYADVFDFPMTPEEIHHFLIADRRISLEEVQHALGTSRWLSEMVEQIDRYLVYIGRAELIPVRLARERASQKLWPVAVRYGNWLARLPFVRMVALTGALAMRNVADDDDDLDYIVVTTPGRVWIARAFAIVLVRLARLRGVEICPNYVLAETALQQERQNIFLAHEVVQMVPLYGYELYRRFRAANVWVDRSLPNARDTFYSEPERPASRLWRWVKLALEILLGGTVGDWLERWEYHRKLQRFAPEMQKPHSSARLDETQIKGHFDDHGHPALQQYFKRLREYGLDNQAAAVPGD
jgi:hypothetical protein